MKLGGHLENKLTYNHFFFADDVKLIAPRSQQRELWSSIQQALRLSRRLDLPFNARKSPNLSIGDPSDYRLVISEELDGSLMTKCEQINKLGITVNSALTPSANVLTAANKAREMLYFIKKVIYMPDEGDLRTFVWLSVCTVRCGMWARHTEGTHREATNFF